ncbi:MAG: prepilin peptidase, partial [Actinomycetota bacterium]|nr:prepilin peptidase [Actinomycetota bacterium]
MASPAPWWVLLVVTTAGLGLGVALARQLASAGYRLDDEAERPLPGPPAVVAAAVPLLWGLLAWRLGGTSEGAALPAYLLLAWLGVG